MFLYVCITLTVLLALIRFARTKRKRFQNLPNGPSGIPVFGNLLQLARKPHLKLSKWAEEYGHLYTIDLIGKPALVINDLKTMRDLFGNMNSTGKFSTATIDVIHGANHGVVNTEGSVWYEQHKYFMRVFRKFGFRGGNQLVPTILKECNDLCNWIGNELKESSRGSLTLDETILHSVANIIWNSVTGEQHNAYDNKMVRLFDKMIKQFNDASFLIFMPWLRFIAPEKTGWNMYVKTCNEFQKYIENCFEKQKLVKKSSRGTGTPKNIIDAYLEHVENCEDPQSTFYGENGMKHSLYAVRNLVIGGGETTSSNIKWLIHYLVAYPEIQSKLQAEVDAVVSEEQDLVTIDKTRLPYLEAVILEVLRISTLLPIGVIHRLIADVTYENFLLPKGTFLIANLYHANMDKNVWKDPQAFRPERFLEGAQAERKKLRDCVVAFQEGRRKCPGEQLAKNMTFWYAFKLVEKYSFHRDESKSTEEYLEPVSGIMMLPPKIGVVVKERKK